MSWNVEAAATEAVCRAVKRMAFNGYADLAALVLRDETLCEQARAVAWLEESWGGAA